MWTFIFAGSIYLTGVAIILVLKPTFMFTPDGNWKEFGIGQNEARYTPFTFWLFCLVWAFISYILVLAVLPAFDSDSAPALQNVRRNVRNKRFVENSDLVFEDELVAPSEQAELPKGYYVLNRKASKMAGVPKYMYSGPEEPV